MYFCKMYSAWQFAGQLLKFMGLLVVACIHSSSETIFHRGVSNLNGTEGKYITMQILLTTTALECHNVQWLKNGKKLGNSDRFTPYEEKGKLSLKIGPLQRLHKGNYSVMCDDHISKTIFLNIIEIPSPDYPKILLRKLNDSQLEIRCISENTLPRPKLWINRKELGIFENVTYIWTIKTVDIKANMTKEDYFCKLQVGDFYINNAIKTASQVIEFLVNISSESASHSGTTNRYDDSTNGHDNISTSKTVYDSTSGHDDDYSTLKAVAIIFALIFLLLIIGFIVNQEKGKIPSNNTNYISLYANDDISIEDILSSHLDKIAKGPTALIFYEHNLRLKKK